MRILYCILACLLLAGCASHPTESTVSAEAPVSRAPAVSFSSSSESASVSSAAPAVSTVTVSSEAAQASTPAEAEESLRDRLWINFERPLYGAETNWLYLWVNNKSEEPVYVMQNYRTERLTEEGWIQIGEERSFDNPSLQVPVEPEESRLVGVYLGWMGEYSERYGDERIPAGEYRVQLTINRDLVFEVPFSVQEDPLAPDTTYFELRTLEEIYAPDAAAINYELLNKTDHEITFRYDCLLEKWDGQVWKRYKVPGNASTFVLNLRPGESVRESFSLAGLKEPLEEGRYRLVKTVVRSPYYAEFEVSDRIIPLVGDDEEEE